MKRLKKIKAEGLAICKKAEAEKRSLTPNEKSRLNKIIEEGEQIIKKRDMKTPHKQSQSNAEKMASIHLGEDRSEKFVFGKMARSLVSGKAEHRSVQLAGNVVANNNVKPIIEELGAELILAKAGVPIVDGTGYDNHIWPVQTGNPTAHWVAEGSQVTASDATFTGRTAGTYAVASEVRVSRQLMASTQDVDKAISSSVARQVARGIEQAAFADTSIANSFESLVNISGSEDVYSAATDGTTLDNFEAYVDLKKALKGENVSNMAFFMHPDLEAGFGGLLDTSLQPMGPSPYIFNEVYEKTYTSTLFETDLTKGAGTGLSNIIALDPQALRVVMKENLTMRLDERRSDYLEVVFLAVAMVDIIAVHPAAIKYAGAVKF
jgi:HK97 family phage major capsid protein